MANQTSKSFVDNLGKIYGVYAGGFIGFVIILAILEQMGVPNRVIGYCFVFLTIGVYAYIGVISRTSEISEYYVAGRVVPPFFNGMATGADWMSAASFISMAGGLYLGGYGGLGYVLGWTGGYVLVGVLLAPYLRKFGQFTVPDFLGVRYEGNTARMCGVVVLFCASFTYIVAQCCLPDSRGVAVDQALRQPDPGACLRAGARADRPARAEARHTQAARRSLCRRQGPVQLGRVQQFLGAHADAHDRHRVAATHPDALLHHAERQGRAHLGRLEHLLHLPALFHRAGVRGVRQARGLQDIIDLSMPEIAGLPYVISGLVAAGGLAAALSTADGLLLAIANALSHDVYYKMIDPKASTMRRLVVARVLLVVVAIIAAAVAGTRPAGIIQMVAWAFSLAAAGLFAPLVLGIWWKRTTAAGAIAGMIVGFSVCVYYLVGTRYFGMTEWFGIRNISSALFGLPLAFLVTWIVSLMTPAPSKEMQEFVDTIRVPKGELHWVAGQAHD